MSLTLRQLGPYIKCTVYSQALAGSEFKPKEDSGPPQAHGTFTIKINSVVYQLFLASSEIILKNNVA